jgi:hypothetical protein
MKKSLITLALVAFASASAFATSFNNTTNNDITNNVNTNANTNTQGQLQGQVQGQQQGQSQIANGGNSVSGANAIAVTNSNSSSNSAGGHSSASASGGRSEANNSNSITVEAQERNPVSTATAPALTAVNGTCSGSTSVGAQGTFFGFSAGSTSVEEGCDTRYDAYALYAMGQPKAAINRLCDKKEVRKALRAAGTICPQDEEEEKACQVYMGNDPVVRRRMGCD